MTKAFARLIAILLVAGTPALAADPDSMAGYWAVRPSQDAPACDIELLSAIAHEFEGVWHVARPLHYEDNRAACRAAGIDDIVAWSMPEAGHLVWLLADGDAGFMEFAPGMDGTWTIVRSGHATMPGFTLGRLSGLPTD